MIYEKDGCPFPESNRYNQIFEYMFVFSKGKPKTTNLLKRKTNYDVKEIGKQRTNSSRTYRQKDGSIIKGKYETNKELVTRFNIWRFPCGYMKTNKEDYTYEHPAMFPEKLAKDHILSWSNEGDVVFDPLAGSGTTLKMAKLSLRKYIGIEISPEYCEIIKRRLEQETLFDVIEEKSNQNSLNG